ncbi:MAG: hypothetical protein ABSA68_16645 [Xanthobacteraceae bacterium]|jgi:hypothetical protein
MTGEKLFQRARRDQMAHWRVILAALIGVIVGGAIATALFLYTSTRVREENTARELLSEVVALMGLQEGWLLQGEGNQTAKLSDHPGLPETQSGSGLWLLPVEIRAILDEAQWNAPSDPSYGFLQGRSVWIIRNQILPDAPLSYSGVNQAHFPALISSAGRQELCAWIERVQIAYNGGTLTDRGLAPLRPYLVPLAQEDRVSALRILLSRDARNFLAEIRARWGKALFAD